MVEAVASLRCIAGPLRDPPGSYRKPYPSRSDRFPEFGAQSAVGLGTRQSTATPTGSDFDVLTIGWRPAVRTFA
jgi:hypothetical protein